MTLLGQEIIKATSKTLPNQPGGYQMQDDKGNILYIGKAKVLSNRVKNYLSLNNLTRRIQRMVSLTKSMNFFVTNTELEAIILECNLIKKHKPRFNILLRDDKSFPYIFIGHKDKWSQLTKLRGKKNRDGYYFGPFSSIGSANWTIKILQKRAKDITKLLLPYKPIQIISELAEYKANNPDFNIEKVHFFPLGGIKKVSEFVQEISKT